MCGRYDLTRSPQEVAAWFRVRHGNLNFPARYNIAPSQAAPVVRLDRNGERELAPLHWGLIPSWARDARIGYSTINARAETVDTKPSFRAAFRRRRCLIPATGYYEWQANKGGKQPWRFVPAEDELFGFAGLWEHWEDRSGTGDTIESFSIIVTAANDLARPIHDRMPVIIAPADYAAWLGAEDTARALALFQPCPAASMTAYRVSKRVGSPRNDDPDLIEPIPGQQELSLR